MKERRLTSSLPQAGVLARMTLGAKQHHLALVQAFVMPPPVAKLPLR